MLEYSIIIAKNFDYLLKNNKDKPKVDPKITDKYRNYAKSFLKMIQNMKGISIFRNEISDDKDSQYIGIMFENIPDTNPYKYQTYRFSDHTRNFGDSKLMSKFTFSVSPKEHTYNDADELFRHFYNINMNRENKNGFKLYSIMIRKQNPVEHVHGGRRTNKKEFNYYVSVATNEGMYYGFSAKGATSAVNNMVENGTKKPLSTELKQIILTDLDEKIKELQNQPSDAKLSGIVKIPNETLSIQELLSCILNLVKKVIE
jgi:hypothetical protein